MTDEIRKCAQQIRTDAAEIHRATDPVERLMDEIAQGHQGRRR